MLVLGIHHGHDSAAALVRDGKIIADVTEERFTRLKHTHDYPLHAMSYCLAEAGLQSIRDVDYVALSCQKPSRQACTVLGLPEPTDLRTRAVNLGRKILRHPTNHALPIHKPDYTVPVEKVVHVEHHLAHAASAYYTRPDTEDYLIFTLDGAGDDVSTAVWKGEGTTIRPLQKLHQEALIGWAYSIVTEALHWWHGDGEGKTMGLAPYGNADNCRGVLDEYFPVFEKTNVARRTNFGHPSAWTEHAAFQYHLDEAKDVAKLIEKYGREDIAAEAQRKLEECVIAWIRAWVLQTGIRKLAFSGGVFLNVKLNQRIWEARHDPETHHDLFEFQHIFPNAGDSGLAVGAALKVYHDHKPFCGYELKDLYWGPEYSNEEIEKLLRENKLPLTRCDDIIATAADMLAEDKIIGWFQGRMESGPRALGNRSILMSPLKPEAKDIINAQVKFREGFRPFCPSLLHEKRDVYLKNCRDEFFMITSFDVTDAKRDKVPAVVHVDGTLRPQLVKKEANPTYWNLINAFGERTGEYILLNTSFNIKGEPIICSPREAIRCFYDGGLDALFLGDYLLTKEDFQTSDLEAAALCAKI